MAIVWYSRVAWLIFYRLWADRSQSLEPPHGVTLLMGVRFTLGAPRHSEADKGDPGCCSHGGVSPCCWEQQRRSASAQRGGYNPFATASGADAVLGAPWVSDYPGALEWAAELKMA